MKWNCETIGLGFGTHAAYQGWNRTSSLSTEYGIFVLNWIVGNTSLFSVEVHHGGFFAALHGTKSMLMVRSIGLIVVMLMNGRCFFCQAFSKG
jgi:hypothetical protein